jgi:hypothetical protein
MAVPAFGTSHRIEISNRYISYNERSRTNDDKFRVYETLDPRENVAEEGQVVLLDTRFNANEESFYAKTEVIPDAAGYEVEFDMKQISSEERECFLRREIVKYKVGVNQVERGVKSVHTATGHGWDISYTPGQPVDIVNTGSEPIHRFDYVGLRFPNPRDVTAQVETWNSTKPGTSVCRFATFPVRENWEAVKFERFRSELLAVAEETERGYGGVDVTNPCVEYIQLPGLLRIIETVQQSMEKSKVKELYEQLETYDDKDFSIRTSNIMTNEDGIKSLLSVALSAMEFAETLRPPHVVAQVLDFRCVQPQLKSQAECGDVMRCMLC